MYSSSITCQPKFPRRVTDLQLIFPQRTVRINTCTLIVAQTQLQTACCHANVPNFAKTQSRARRRCAVMHTTPSSTRMSATACLVKRDSVFFFSTVANSTTRSPYFKSYCRRRVDKMGRVVCKSYALC